jgi:hypothetical protein
LPDSSGQGLAFSGSKSGISVPGSEQQAAAMLEFETFFDNHGTLNR